ncbi:MAG: methylated-DNA--[protein]-cysteine S-methyltransferase [Candidatus Aminicenantes bacterium]|nr:MAG: methylated-DNA--[protein]-cysteine S-methyltransferase [Candidatus Aminicenantes bacterium]
MFYTLFDFPIGKIFFAKTSKGLSFASFVKDHSRLDEITDFFKKRNILLDYDESKFRLEYKLFNNYFKGKKVSFASLPIDFISGTPFQRKVWLETGKIPHGKTETYKSIAQKLNQRGYRSIGQALSQNPILIIIPCHRVIGSDGTLVGFGPGLEIKEYLLRLERGEVSA